MNDPHKAATPEKPDRPGMPDKPKVVLPAPPPAPRTAADVVLGKPTPESVMEALRPIHDPELMISIVDLGLVYGAEVSADGKSVDVRMTLTSPGCPIGPELMAAVDHTARLIPGIDECRVQLVWDPPWDPTKMASEAAKEQLGIW